MVVLFFCRGDGESLDLHVPTHSFPTRRSSDLDHAIMLLEARFGFAGVSVISMMLFARVRSAHHYDALMLAWVLLAVLSNFFTIAHRPSGHFGFLGNSPMLILLFFVFFRNRFNLQLLSAAALTASDFFTV